MKTRCYLWKGDTIAVTNITYKPAKGEKPVQLHIPGYTLTSDEQRALLYDIEKRILLKKRFDLLDKDGRLSYLRIEKQETDENDLLDDDLMRAFEQGVTNTFQLTKSKWEQLAKVGIIFLVCLFALGSFLIFTVMLNKGIEDFGGSLTGIVKEGINVTKVFGA